VTLPPRLVERIWEGDTSLWLPDDADPAAHREIRQRLGWLRLPEDAATRMHGLDSLIKRCRGKFSDVVLIGMGGSSLGAEALAAVLARPEGSPRWTLFDSTHPATVSDGAAKLSPDGTLLLVASKSGTTVETLSIYGALRARFGDKVHAVALGDPDSPMSALAQRDRFEAFVATPADVGGRFSLFSEFGHCSP
jgi:glucose-6-phosphate isomerase